MNLALEDVVVKIAQDTLGMNRISEWFNYSEDELWFELVACNLGSRVRFELAKTATRHLDTLGLLQHCRFLYDPVELENDISSALKNQFDIKIDGSGYNLRYPFPNLKAKHIVKSANAIYGNGYTLSNILYSCTSPQDARSMLVTIASGIGAKQASLFLRNVGYSNELAVLDAHVLRYMSYVGILPNIVKSITSISKYETIEKLFKVYSDKLSLRMDSLDIAIWIVMRTMQGEF